MAKRKDPETNGAIAFTMVLIDLEPIKVYGGARRSVTTAL